MVWKLFRTLRLTIAIFTLNVKENYYNLQKMIYIELNSKKVCLEWINNCCFCDFFDSKKKSTFINSLIKICKINKFKRKTLIINGTPCSYHTITSEEGKSPFLYKEESTNALCIRVDLWITNNLLISLKFYLILQMKNIFKILWLKLLKLNFH